MALACLAFCAARADDALPLRAYVLGPNDVLQLKVYQEDDLDAPRLRVALDGTVTLPLLGKLNLGGKTVEEAQTIIYDELAKDYLVNPQVTLTVVEYAKRKFTILGEVNRPGTYEIPPDEVFTVIHGIAMAGSFTPKAKQTTVKVTRVVAGKKESIELDVRSMIRDTKTPAFYVQPGDTILVPEGVF